MASLYFLKFRRVSDFFTPGVTGLTFLGSLFQGLLKLSTNSLFVYLIAAFKICSLGSENNIAWFDGFC